MHDEAQAGARDIARHRARQTAKRGLMARDYAAEPAEPAPGGHYTILAHSRPW